MQSIGKDGAAIGNAITIVIVQDQQFVIQLALGFHWDSWAWSLPIIVPSNRS